MSRRRRGDGGRGGGDSNGLKMMGDGAAVKNAKPEMNKNAHARVRRKTVQ
jgi:hypothetical protein